MNNCTYKKKKEKKNESFIAFIVSVMGSIIDSDEFFPNQIWEEVYKKTASTLVLFQMFETLSR